MNFYNLIKEILGKENIDLFVDMDGVIASYRYGEVLDFKTKRPLTSNIEVLRKVSELDGVNLFILSICRENYQRDDKNNWLDKYAPFFKYDNRYILSKEEITDMSSADIKLDFLKKYKSDNKVILVDDDIRILKKVGSNLDNILVLQDSELVD